MRCPALACFGMRSANYNVYKIVSFKGTKLEKKHTLLRLKRVPRPALACVGLCWTSLAVVGRRWPSFAVVGPCGPSLACVGLRWPSLAVVGRCGPLLTCVLPSVGLHWPSLTCVGLRWPSLAAV